MKTCLATVALCTAALLGHHFAFPKGAMSDETPPESNTLILHEWGTFTSFSGSNGLPVGFRPNNSDLPDFIYHHPGDPGWKAARLIRDGTISMETPVIYFYSGREIPVSVRVDFPKGWITEWYPFASTEPGVGQRDEKKTGETIEWKIQLRPGVSVPFPLEKVEKQNEVKNYYAARETDAVPLQTEFDPPANIRNYVSGGRIIQSEKFLFYRGVGTFPTPVGVEALAGGKIRVKNTGTEKLSGLVLIAVRNGQVGFRTLEGLEKGAEAVAALPETSSASTAGLSEAVTKALTAAGLYEREASAMVKTWDSAWFHEEGTRLLYLVPRTRTDELLPLKVEPRPNEVVRVLVGRHDFLTPEQESMVDRQMERLDKARAQLSSAQTETEASSAKGELSSAQSELAKVGRFSREASQMALKKRLDKTQK
jgi:hypothetical protein